MRIIRSSDDRSYSYKNYEICDGGNCWYISVDEDNTMEFPTDAEAEAYIDSIEQCDDISRAHKQISDKDEKIYGNEQRGSSIVRILMDRDGMSRRDAIDLVNDVRDMVQDAVDEGDYLQAEDIMYDELGLELDYIYDLLDM